MALKRIISKTIKMTRVTLFTADLKTDESGYVTIELVGAYHSERKLMKALKAKYEDEDIKILKLVDWETYTTTRIMDEQTFYENSKAKEN